MVVNAYDSLKMWSMIVVWLFVQPQSMLVSQANTKHKCVPYMNHSHVIWPFYFSATQHIIQAMAIWRPRLHIPLFLRELTFRILLIAATSILSFNILNLVQSGSGAPAWYWFFQLLPLLLILHHILRYELGNSRICDHWTLKNNQTVATEDMASYMWGVNLTCGSYYRWGILTLCFLEAFLTCYTVVGYFYIPEIRVVASALPYDKGAAASHDLLRTGLELAMVASSFISGLFLFCDILNNHWNFFFRRYNFSAELRQQGQEWSFAFGKFTSRRRFRCGLYRQTT